MPCSSERLPFSIHTQLFAINTQNYHLKYSAFIICCSFSAQSCGFFLFTSTSTFAFLHTYDYRMYGVHSHSSFCYSYHLHCMLSCTFFNSCSGVLLHSIFSPVLPARVYSCGVGFLLLFFVLHQGCFISPGTV